MDEELRKAHTGEHILFQSLSRFFPGIKLEKIDLTPGKKKFFVVYADKLEREIVLKAQVLANQIIEEGREVKEFIGTKDEVLKKFGEKVRVRWERIKDEKVRIIEVDGFDYSACSGEHVKNTREIEMILITKINSLGKGRYEIEFEVGRKAKIKALEASNILFNLMEISGSNEKTIEKNFLNLREKALKLEKSVKRLTSKILENLQPQKINELNFYSSLLENLDNEELGREAAKLVEKEKTLVFLVNQVEGKNFFTLAKSKDLNINLQEIFEEILRKFEGKGGGKENFYRGVIENPKEAMEWLKNKILELKI